MSDAVDANLALARRAYEAWNEGGMEALANYLDPDAVIHAAADVPDVGVLRGSEIEARMRELSGGVMGHVQFKVRSLEGSGDYVLAELEMSGQGAASGASVATTMFQLTRLADGRVHEIRAFLDADQARRAYECLAGPPAS